MAKVKVQLYLDQEIFDKIKKQTDKINKEIKKQFPLTDDLSIDKYVSQVVTYIFQNDINIKKLKEKGANSP